MSQRMTDERLAEYEQLIKGWCPSSDPDDVCVELLQALKAERQEVDRLDRIFWQAIGERNAAERKLARLEGRVTAFSDHMRNTGRPALADRILKEVLAREATATGEGE